MGNTFGRTADDHEAQLSLSNGGSTVFLDVLSLAACDIAENGFERGYGLLCCNSRIGLGNESYDLEELPGSEENWLNQRAFLLRVIRLARQEHHWQLLDYEPPFVHGYLQEYEQIVAGYVPTWPLAPLTPLWTEHPSPHAFTRCTDHGLYLGDYTDCRLC